MRTGKLPGFAPDGRPAVRESHCVPYTPAAAPLQLFSVVLASRGCHEEVPQMTGVKQQRFIPSQPGGQRSEVKASAGPYSQAGPSCLPASGVPGHLWPLCMTLWRRHSSRNGEQASACQGLEMGVGEVGGL